ncbi:MAG TPA: glycosyltransferase family 39 protein [Candidatus Acidoferrales bacterium]|nr:glycosyltransferase family 39 protein [Candidatus Acidoferrales bacterium]
MSTTRTSRQIFWALLIVAVLVICFFTGLASLGLTGPDEPRYAFIARAMTDTGDWITPKLYGQPWFEKPALYYWTAAIGFHYLNSAEWAARLPSAIAALIAALAAGLIALWRYGMRTARATILIFATCAGVIAFARAAAPDMLFTAALALALFSAANIVEKRGGFPVDPLRVPPSDKLDLFLVGIWIGLATLAKGPAAIILAGGSVLLWALATRNLRIALRMLHPLAIFAFAIIALPWYVLCARANPNFFHVFIVEHNFERYLTPMFQHPQPFWFFGPIILLGLMPWTAFLIGAAFDGVRIFRRAEWRTSSGFFIACWAIFPVLFFSFSKSKLPEYVLPIFPALAVLMGRSFVCAMDHARRKAQWMGVGTGTMWVLLGAGGAIGFHRLPMYTALNREQIAQLALISLFLGIAIGVVEEFLSLWRKLWAVIALTAAACAVLVLVAERSVLPKLDPLLSTRQMAHEFRANADGASVYSLGGVNRSCEYGLQFYLESDSLPAFDAKKPDEHYVLMTWGGDMKLNDAGVLHRKIIARYLPYCWIESVQPGASP